MSSLSAVPDDLSGKVTTGRCRSGLEIALVISNVKGF